LSTFWLPSNLVGAVYVAYRRFGVQVLNCLESSPEIPQMCEVVGNEGQSLMKW
jgi:hypothetical protein